jgi:very-short-patch-repair endonuclease
MYTKLSDTEKKKIILQLYSKENKSFQDIAEACGTYANKIRRDAKKFNIPIRDKSAAQKNALKTGKHKHPTKGTKRDEETKNKIGAGVMGFWDNLTDAELDNRKKIAKNNWDNMSDEQKSYIRQQANSAVRQASKVGSKLEKFLLDNLLKDGYRVDFHKEQILSNTKLQIDLFLPKINVAIEVDGPSHFLPVWGDDVLDKNIKYDNKKTGLILGKGLVLIRIKQTREFSKARSLLLYNQLLEHLNKISIKYPDKDNRYIEIGE